MITATMLAIFSHPLALVSALWMRVGIAAAVLVVRRYLRTRHPSLAWFAAGWAFIGLSQVEQAISWIVFPLLVTPRLVATTDAMHRANTFSSISGAVAAALGLAGLVLLAVGARRLPVPRDGRPNRPCATHHTPLLP